MMEKFWVLVEHILNSVLFTLGGVVWGGWYVLRSTYFVPAYRVLWLTKPCLIVFNQYLEPGSGSPGKIHSAGLGLHGSCLRSRHVDPFFACIRKLSHLFSHRFGQ